MTCLSIVVAMSRNRVIGRDGTLPWRLPADLKRFKRLTMGHHLLVGRRTWESIGRLLPGRTMVVITRRRDYAAEGVRVVHSIEEAIAVARQAGETEAFVGGGAEVYAATLPRADRMYLTRVDADVEGDTHFPEFDRSCWREVSSERHEADERHAWPFRFLTLERVR